MNQVRAENVRSNAASAPRILVVEDEVRSGDAARL